MNNKGKFVINNGSTIILDAPYMELYIPTLEGLCKYK